MRKALFILLILIGLAALGVFSPLTLQSPLLVPTALPTYDPLIEPPLPPNPTEFELGRNLYWHWCMTCHGDRGQGLTDEFRKTWVSDHQNCWGRGCHAGHNGDMGFPIPTVVPAIVGQARLARFTTLSGLNNFLKTTHPPQSPGILKDSEYHAIAVYVFTLNNRQLVEIVPTLTQSPTLAPTSTPTATPALHPLASQHGSSFAWDPEYTSPFGLVTLGILAYLFRKRQKNKKT